MLPKVRRGGATVVRIALFTLTMTASSAVMGEATRNTDAGGDSNNEAVAQDSPRASLAQFLSLCRAGQHVDASRYLDLPSEEKGRGPELAGRLKAVLDRHVWFDLSLISALPEGDSEDGLPVGTDEIARIPGPGGAPQPVRLVRRGADGPWVFSPATVNRIDSWYQQLDSRWLFEHLPDPLLQPGPHELLYWQWAALPIFLLVAWALGHLLGRLTRRVLAGLVRRTSTQWDDEVFVRIRGPMTFAWALAVAYAILPLLALYQPAEEFVHRMLRAAFLVVLFWALARMFDVARSVVAASPWATDHPGARALLPLAARVGKALVLAIATVALLSELGYPVASLIAGLGIGGLAMALAAQKTVENLFGAFSLGADQPFREGDFVRIEEFVGTVERIGLRSTRIRTLDRTLITIPNGRLADMRLESLTERDRMRLACTVGLVYSTTAAQMREVLDGLERTLRAHPRIWTDAVVVRFKEFGDSSLNIEVMAWFQTREWSEFQLIRQEVLLQFMHVVENAGSSFAFPTRTVHLIPDKG
jgi:MscS family membrane protein